MPFSICSSISLFSAFALIFFRPSIDTLFMFSLGCPNFHRGQTPVCLILFVVYFLCFFTLPVLSNIIL
jgi:hypothetical protein